MTYNILNCIKLFLKKIINWRLDMNKEDVYIYYSPATDITGKKLQEALGIDGGDAKPKNKKLVIGWGAKTKESTVFPAKVEVLNHPDAIRINRNKFEAMKVMAENIPGNISKYALADEVITALSSGNINLPLVGRTKYHQGGKGFWSCPTIAQVNSAISAGAHHFIEMVAIKDEYRLHIFNGEVIHSQKKVQRTDEDFEKAFIEDELARQKNLATKNGNPFDEDTAKLMLRRQAKNATAGGANMMLRSNKMGWKFSVIKKKSSLKFINDCMKDIAKNALDALGLTFGAVDCCIDVNNNMFIFEINSGPGLEGTSLDKYIEAFKLVMSNKKISTKTNKMSKTAKVAASTEKTTLKRQLADLQTMVDESENDAELATIKKLGARLIFGGQ